MIGNWCEQNKSQSHPNTEVRKKQQINNHYRKRTEKLVTKTSHSVDLKAQTTKTFDTKTNNK